MNNGVACALLGPLLVIYILHCCIDQVHILNHCLDHIKNCCLSPTVDLVHIACHPIAVGNVGYTVDILVFLERQKRTLLKQRVLVERVHGKGR